MASKTKAELEAELQELKNQLEAKKKEEKHDDCANEIHNLYNSFIKAGFTEDQAWALTSQIVINGTKPKNSIF
jgi:hypothetical protein